MSGDQKLAFRCVNWSDVIISGAVGAIGPGFLDIFKSAAGGNGGGIDAFHYFGRAMPAGYAIRKMTPDVRISVECECKDFKLPAMLGELFWFPEDRTCLIFAQIR